MSNNLIVFLGDSHFKRLQKLIKLPPDICVNFAKSGSNVAEARERLNNCINENKEFIWYLFGIYLFNMWFLFSSVQITSGPLNVTLNLISTSTKKSSVFVERFL